MFTCVEAGVVCIQHTRLRRDVLRASAQKGNLQDETACAVVLGSGGSPHVSMSRTKELSPSLAARSKMRSAPLRWRRQGDGCSAHVKKSCLHREPNAHVNKSRSHCFCLHQSQLFQLYPMLQLASRRVQKGRSDTRDGPARPGGVWHHTHKLSLSPLPHTHRLSLFPPHTHRLSPSPHPERSDSSGA